ncbi:MAG: NAD(P)H-hydrate dehydratase [Porphyromonas sp.]|nr:NAD(P)H-hydrate dehydratase [Porphyromonas sp.]
MRQIYNSRSIREMEQQACQGVGAMTDEQIMETKSNVFCNRFRRDFPGKHRVVVFAGVGAKGCIALSIAGTLQSFGHEVIAVALRPTERTLSATQESLIEGLVADGLPLMEVRSEFRPPVINVEDIVIDGIADEEELPLLPMYAGVVRYLNGKAAIKLALDMPTGLRSEDNTETDREQVFHAQVTYTFYGPKLSFLLPENDAFVGRWAILQLGLECESKKDDSPYFLFGEAEMSGRFDRRAVFSHKYDYGKTMLIAGSRGMYGAAILSARAALAVGAGHLTTHVPWEAEMLMHGTVPEVLVQRDESDSIFTSVAEVEDYDAIAIGPGIGRDKSSGIALQQLLMDYRRPMVLDADALNLLSLEGQGVKALPEGSIITPHVGEFERLFGPFQNHFQRIEFAREVARESHIYIILKGAYTATITPMGEVVFNTSGNPGLATAGTGDVLTGVLLALLGRGMSSYESAVVGVFVHGFAADLYRSDFSEESLTASELIRYLPRVFKSFKNW